MSSRKIDGITIYFKNIDFYHFYDNALYILKSDDPLSYIRIINNVSSIVESEFILKNKNSNIFFGCFTRTFYDIYKPEDRKKAGYRRFASYLLKFAIELKLLYTFHKKEIVMPYAPYIKKYLRLMMVASRRELYCSETLKCEPGHIQAIQNWLLEARTKTGSRKRAE